jgi:acyl carrier protein
MKANILSILIETRPESNFESSTNFIEDGLLDSLDMVVIISEIEEQFKVKIDGTDIVPENFCSLEAIVRLIRSAK